METSSQYAAGGGMTVLMLAVAMIVAIFAFFGPSLIALWRKHPSSFVIIILNLFCGASGVGWVVALVWALGPIKKAASGKDLEDNLATLARMQQLLDQGTLTPAEFNAMKQQYVAAAA